MPPRVLSLRTELLLNTALIAATALALAVASVVVLYGVFDSRQGAIYISVLVAADVCVLVGYVAYQVERKILRPLRDAMTAAEAIAAGDLARRLPAGNTVEMSNLAESINRMTDTLLEDRTQLVRAEKMASVGRLASGVAHEIGNPLGAINGYTHLLRAAVPADSKDAEEALTGIDREASRIDRIVRGLLDYARARPRTPGPVDLNDTARTVVELLTTQGLLKHIDLELSPAAEATHVSGDRHDLEQVLVNLLLNAVDAMDGRGSLSLIIRRTTRSEMMAGGRRSDGPEPKQHHPATPRALRWLDAGGGEEVAMVAVTDSGPGIPEEDFDKVFEPFYTTKDPGKGTGLGLAIVARAIENFGGTIWVSRSREGGAAFRILLPVAPARPRNSLKRVRISDERLALT
ncbi:MAG TPA: ATP-binding protein [Gemmatimonadaceae bacterium]|nr:ATP-binding protein [Gemmatimonadaceae bacterium]